MLLETSLVRQSWGMSGVGVDVGVDAGVGVDAEYHLLCYMVQ